MSKRRYFRQPPRVQIAKADSYADSLLLGLTAGILWAPTALWASVKDELAQIAGGLLKLVWALLIFTLSRVAVIAAALAGRLKHAGWGYGVTHFTSLRK